MRLGGAQPRAHWIILFLGLGVVGILFWDWWWQLSFISGYSSQGGFVAEPIPRRRFQRTRTAQLRSLAHSYLAPWQAFGIPRHALDAIEVPFHGAGVHIRIPSEHTGQSRDTHLLYRVLDHFPQTYRDQRLRWILELTLDAMPLPPGTEFYVNLGDGPRATADSSGRAEFAGMPIFSFRTAAPYIDIPIPDPAEYGAYGNYQLNDDDDDDSDGDGTAQEEHGDEDSDVSLYARDSVAITTAADIRRAPYADWGQREPRAFFRGVTSAFEHHDGNHVADVRIQLHMLSARNPNLLDAGVVAYRKFRNTSQRHQGASKDGTGASESTPEQGLAPPLPRTPLSHMRRYRYVLDVDGGLGSSRKRAILRSSGAMPLFQQSPWRQWYESLLVPYVHYVPVDRWLRDLTHIVRWYRTRDAEAKRIATQAHEFARQYLSYSVAVSYYRILLLEYAQLLRPRQEQDGGARDARVPWNHCEARPSLRHGPAGCWRGWFVYRRGDSLPFGCTHRRGRTPPHHCWRTLPRNESTSTLRSPRNASETWWIRQEKIGIDTAYESKAS
ncbi:hypothetical protein CCYA_CCYA11G3191 [Cyanidiococcus yangmingshanensis]|nr:hypothetical protein CCYA_CCYA11G3191 [Cyanidiococcus yangmingshanensis]